MVELKGYIGEIEISPPWMNASGVLCTTEEELAQILKSAAGGAITKTMTLEPREGNPKPRCYWSEFFSINSMGIPNQGIDYYVDAVKRLKVYEKPLIASMAGFKKEEFSLLAKKIEASEFHGVEVNLSCPNVEGKEVFAYDFSLLREILISLRSTISKPMGVKLPPYSRRSQIRQVCKILIESSVDFISLSNSYPLGAAILVDREETVIFPNGGIGGLGGQVFRPIVLGQILLFSRALKGRIPIMGVGGIERGIHIWEHLLAGASLFQIGTCLLKEGPSAFQRIQKEVEELASQKGVSSLQEKCGKVKIPNRAIFAKKER